MNQNEEKPCKFKVVTFTENAEVSYSVKQAQEDGVAEFTIRHDNGKTSDHTIDLELGDSIALEVMTAAADAVEAYASVLGFIVGGSKRHGNLLGIALNHFGDEYEVFYDPSI